MTTTNTNDIGKMAGLEKELERRFDKTASGDGWTASANILYGTATASLRLEKFYESPCLDNTDIRHAQLRLRDFLVGEFDMRDISVPEVIKVSFEELRNTIAPHHAVLEARVDAGAWIARNS